MKDTKRTRLLSTLFALGIFASLPIPEKEPSNGGNILIPFLWAFVGIFTWALWFRADLVWPLWFASMLITVVIGWKLHLLLPFLLLMLWALWYRIRIDRELSEK